MEAMTIRLVSVVEKERRVRARLRADAPDAGVRIWLEVKFDAEPRSNRGAWAREAYDRALSVLDPA